MLTAGTVVLAMGATSITALAAAQYRTPAEAAAGITGRTLESVIAERTDAGKTYGTIASEAGKLNEFKAEILEIKKDKLAAQVAAGTITQERADAILAAIEENQAACDGTGSARTGRSMGAKFGSDGTGPGTGGANRGFGRGQGAGCGMGLGGMRLQDGSCYAAQ